jgi:multisubunit Na+/H+ antiporter MnhB subunit
MIVKGRLLDVVVGGLTGGLVGAVVAINFVIYTGIEQGYEASLVEVFQHSLIAGIVTVIILVAGPVLGVVTARRLRIKRARNSAAETSD